MIAYCKKLIIHIGCRRCGNHAISGWLLNQLPEAKEHIRLKHVPWEFNDFGNILYLNVFTFDGGISAYNIDVSNRELDVILASVEHDSFYNKRLPIDIIPEQVIYIFSLRDVFNFLASAIKVYVIDRNITDKLNSSKKIWAQRAREIDGRTSFVPEKYFISYNNWVIDEDYRKKICDDLGLCFTDRGKNDVVSFCPGSSFEGTQYNGRGYTDETLERYKLVDPTLILRNLTDEMLELNNRIFGNNDEFFMYLEGKSHA